MCGYDIYVHGYVERADVHAQNFSTKIHKKMVSEG
jgi:hypothetical protein